MNRLAGILVLALMFPAAARAGAWVRPEGGVYLRLANKFYSADKIFDQDGNRTPGYWWNQDASFTEFSSNLIAEYGVLEGLTLTFENTAKFMHADEGDNGTVKVYGFSDAILGVRYGFYQRTLVAAVEGRLEIPTGYPRDDDRLRLGPGYLNGHFKLLFGGGLPLGFGNYFDTSIGYRIRGGPYMDDLTLSASVGVETIEDLWVRAGFSAVFNLQDPSGASLGNQSASYLGAGGAVTYLIGGGWGVELAASVDAWGKNSFSGWGLELVVQFER